MGVPAEAVYSQDREPQATLTATSTPRAAVAKPYRALGDASTIDVNLPADEEPAVDEQVTTRAAATTEKLAGEEADEGGADEGDDLEGINALPGRPNAAEETLRDLGYEIVAVEGTAVPWDETAVYYTPGWEEEANALAEPDSRFSDGGENPGFLADVALHVVVGANWAE